MIISSHTNPRIKQIRSLRHRQEREQTGLFFIEGIRLVTEAVQLGADIEMLVVAPELLKSQFAQEIIRNVGAGADVGLGGGDVLDKWFDDPELLRTQANQRALYSLRPQGRGTSLIEVTADVFKSISVKDGPQGLGAVVHQRWESLDQVRLSNKNYWVALDAAQDPGNIGTIMRTGDAFGSAGLMLLGNCADPYDPTALRASMGAIFSQRLVKASFVDFSHWKQRYNYYVTGTSKAAPSDYRKVSYPLPMVLLMGSERLGLSSAQQAICDLMVSIPMVGRSDSLNLAVATGIVLYEVFYQAR